MISHGIIYDEYILTIENIIIIYVIFYIVIY